MLNHKLLLAAVLAACLLAPSMFAGTVTQTCTPSVPTTQGISYTLDCTINAFNTSLGTLTGVTLQLTGVGGSVLPEQTNINTVPLNFTGSTATLEMSYTEDGSSTILVYETATSGACAGVVAAGSTNTSCGSTPFSNLASAVDPDTNLAYYETGGTVTLAGSGGLDGVTGSGVNGQPNAGKLFFGGDGTIGGVLTVTYDYDAGSFRNRPRWRCWARA